MSKNIATLKYPGQESIKVIENGTIRQTGYGFLLVFCSNFVPKTHLFGIFDFKNAVTLKTGLGLGGPSRSLKMSSFDRAHTTSY